MAVQRTEFLFCVQGTVLYAHYGQDSDFRILLDRNRDISGRVVLVRTGKISFAEKVGGFW